MVVYFTNSLVVQIFELDINYPLSSQSSYG